MSAKRVRFTFTDHKGQKHTVEGEVTDTVLPHGRVEVRDDDGGLHHLQPALLEVAR